MQMMLFTNSGLTPVDVAMIEVLTKINRFYYGLKDFVWLINYDIKLNVLESLASKLVEENFSLLYDSSQTNCLRQWDFALKKRRKEIIIKLNLVIESVDEIQMSFDHISVYLFLTSLLLHQIHKPYRMRSRDALIRSKNVLVFKRFYKKNSETEPYLNHILASWKM